jgi:hypothetical protein
MSNPKKLKASRPLEEDEAMPEVEDLVSEFPEALSGCGQLQELLIPFP